MHRQETAGVILSQLTLRLMKSVPQGLGREVTLIGLMSKNALDAVSWIDAVSVPRR